MEDTANIRLPNKWDSHAEENIHEHRGVLVSVGLAALVLLWIVNWMSVLPLVRDSHLQSAQDFSIFYTGSRIVWSGLSAHLYDLSVQAQYQTAPYRLQPLPFNHPAYELILFLPLAKLSFNSAYWAWTALNVVMTLVIAYLLSRHLPYFPRSPGVGAWSFVAAMASFPLIWALCQGQDSILLLLIFVLVYLNLKSGKEATAGIILATGLFKFTLIVPFAVVFLLRGRWRFLAGFLGGSALVAGISIWITGIGGAYQYIQLLSLLAGHPSVGYINPLLMPDARGFLLTILAGSGVHRQGFEVISAAVSILLLVVPFLTFRSQKPCDRFDLWFGLNLTVALVVSPHLYWHDLSVLLLPLLLVANLLAKTGIRTAWMWAAVIA